MPEVLAKFSDIRQAAPDVESSGALASCLMSEVLHPMLMPSDALTSCLIARRGCTRCWPSGALTVLSDCQKCCTRPRWGQMHWRIVDARDAAFNTDTVKCAGEVVCVIVLDRLHPMPVWSDALAKLSVGDARRVAPDASHQVHRRFLWLPEV